MHILGWLALPGTISALYLPTVRLVHVVLDYRLGCKKIELHREQPDQVPDSQPAKAAPARRARRRRTRR